MFYRAKVDALGGSFNTPEWQLYDKRAYCSGSHSPPSARSYLNVTFRKDAKYAPPVAPVLEKPLFTWEPLLITRRCDSEEDQDAMRYVVQRFGVELDLT